MNSPRLTYSPKLTLSPRLSQLRKYHISDKLQNFHGKVRFDFVFIHIAPPLLHILTHIILTNQVSETYIFESDAIENWV